MTVCNRFSIWHVTQFIAFGLALSLIGVPAHGQVTSSLMVEGDSLQLKGDMAGGVEIWPYSERCYQNAWSLKAEGVAQWRGVSLTGYGDWQLWSSCDGKIPGSPLNAETNKVFGTAYGAYLMLHVGDLAVGAQIHRHEVHHIWRNLPDWRGNGFPHDNSWQGAEQRCAKQGAAEKVKPHADGSCPVIGYRERIGPRVAYLPSWGEIALYLPLIQTKELTLRPHVAALTVETQPAPGWKIGATSRMDVERQVYGEIRIQRHVTGPLYIGVLAAHRQTPGWIRKPIDIAAVMLTVQ